jgi:hypothetical protein
MAEEIITLSVMLSWVCVGAIILYIFVEKKERRHTKMKGAIEWIEPIERAICDKPGTFKTLDGGKGISLASLQDAQKKFSSLVFSRVYLVPIKGGTRVMVTHTKFRFFYDYRPESRCAELLINEEYIHDIEKRIPAIIEPLNKLKEGQKAYDMDGKQCVKCNGEMKAGITGNGNSADLRCPVCSMIIMCPEDKTSVRETTC